MYVLALIVATLVVCWITYGTPNRGKGEPFDWTHRRRWWRPRSIFPDDR
jgi:hypothetical protein